jgi:hypothetical protein
MVCSAIFIFGKTDNRQLRLIMICIRMLACKDIGLFLFAAAKLSKTFHDITSKFVVASARYIVIIENVI